MKYKNGIDKQSNGPLFEANELARRKFISQRLANNDFNVTVPDDTDNNQIANSADELSEPPMPRIPRSIEAVKLSNKRVAFEPAYNSNQNSIDNLNRIDSYPNDSRTVRQPSPTPPPVKVNETQHLNALDQAPNNRIAFKSNLMKKPTTPTSSNNNNLESILKKPSINFNQPTLYSHNKKDARHTDI